MLLIGDRGEMSDRRTYGQLCGIAAALDVLGERWTLLLVRELLIGPQRFGELLHNLDGIGPNLLSDRLHTLSEAGVVESWRHDDDKRARSYQLTPLGEQLRDPLLGLGRWGMAVLEPRTQDQTRAHWGLLAVEALVRAHRPEAESETYEFRIDGLVFHIRVENGHASIQRRAADTPAMVASTDSRTFVGIGGGLITPFEAVATGRLTLEGDPGAIMRCSRILGLADGSQDAAAT